VVGVSLYQIMRRSMLLREQVEMARVRQFAELGELAAGIAHEIRNPINAIRLNLHALQRLQRQISEQPAAESVQVIVEANREIERVEGLMKIMLGYARPEKAINEDLDLRAELEATLNFLKPVMDRDHVCIESQLAPGPLCVHIDRNRFRQVIMNLLNNAREAVGTGGRVVVQAGRQRDGIEIVVADNGPGVPVAERERIFDPFYSTKELGTGLGLALVKRFVEEAGGSILCENNNGGGGARFHLLFSASGAEPAELTPRGEPTALPALGRQPLRKT
jgi:signal transduction histidine kinase